ncbi:MAG: hypothetical protein R3E48_21420 [Burkholderiaceae bacterium]
MPSHAASVISVGGTGAAVSAQARLGVSVRIPRILYFRIGSGGAAVDSVDFTVRLANPLRRLDVVDQPYGGALPPRYTMIDGDSVGTSNGSLPVQVWTNNGSFVIDCTGAALSAGANTIPLTDISVRSSSGALPHPGSSASCTPTSAGHSGTNALSANWRYRYRPPTLPPAGDYATVLTYTVSQP